MDQSGMVPDCLTAAPGATARAAGGAMLSLVRSRFRLGLPAEPAPAPWQDGLAQLLAWLGIDADLVHAAPAAARNSRRAAGVPVFAPWLGWSPSAFQHGGLAGLPAAHFVASYLVDHPRGAAPGHRGTDLVLMSPHPALCAGAGGVPLPRAPVLRAMIRRARAEGRERLAIIAHAHQRGALAELLRAAGEGPDGAGSTAPDILAIEEAIVPLMSPRTVWDAVIAMPDLRGTVFTLLAETSGVRTAWPMLWFAGEEGRDLALVSTEAPGEGTIRLPLDAPALIHALALALHAGGAGRAAWRLHDGWARLRDSGVTTAGRGGGDAPYVTEVPDTTFLAMLCRDAAVSKRPQQGWRALKNAETAFFRTPNSGLRVVS